MGLYPLSQETFKRLREVLMKFLKHSSIKSLKSKASRRILASYNPVQIRIKLEKPLEFKYNLLSYVRGLL